MPARKSSKTAALAVFAPATRTWFSGAFAGATAVQEQAWQSISQGQHTLVIAPTGSGKTLAAFLYAIDSLYRERDRTLPDASKGAADGTFGLAGTRVLYISPIKALAVDVQRNLHLPLQGVSEERRRRGDPPVELSVAIRSGDTSTAERAKLVRRPPDILITTPESLFLMLTSNARHTLKGVSTIIIDEIHAVAGSKRGTHLALSLERLDAMLEQPAQRIGLSATVRPKQAIADFLGGDRAVTIIDPPSQRRLDVRIVVPIEDMADIPARRAENGDDVAGSRAGSIWPHLEASILDEVLRRRSTIVFANSRGVAEKLTARLNELYAERLAQQSGELPASAGAMPEQLGSFTGSTSGRVIPGDELIARSHHGSVSKEQRAQTESLLKSGELRCVVATSSLELGIDMGMVDLVIQVAAPPSVASALQRVGRAGHQVGGQSIGHFYPRTRRDLIDSAVCVESMLAGKIESLTPPVNPLDVLAQQTIAAVAMEPVDVEHWFAQVRRAAPYRTLPRSAFEATMDMLAGRYPSDDFAGFRPRLVWNRLSGQLSARPGARQLAVTSGGTIPDRGMYRVMLPEGEERTGSRRVGELDEEMVHESRVNDVITLGATSWRIEQITNDQVVVTAAPGRSARLPFWRGEGVGRPAELGQSIGAFLAALESIPTVDAMPQSLRERLAASGLDDVAVANMLGLVNEQRLATGSVPTDDKLVVERCRDESGDWRIMLHSPYGRRVHDPWALALAERLREQWHIDPAVVASDDGIIARIPDTTGRVPGAELFVFDPDRLRRSVQTCVGGSALFAARFRECASRALLLPRTQPGKRSPLWQQRLRAGELLSVAQQYPDFPILVETARECLQDVYDLDALDELMRRIVQGEVELVDVATQVPSPFAANLLFGYVAEFLYASDAPAAERRASVLSLDSGLLGDLLGQVDLGKVLDPAAIDQVSRELQRLLPERHASGPEGVADLLRELGPMSLLEIAVRLKNEDASTAAQLLQQQGRIVTVRVGGQDQWAAIEDAGRLRDALGVKLPSGIPAAFLEAAIDPLAALLSRYARTRGPFTTQMAAERLGIGVSVVDAVLEELAIQGRVLKGNFGVIADQAEPTGAGNPLALHQWVGEDVFRRLRVRSLQAAREATRPVPVQAYVQLLLERHGVVSSRRLTGAMEGIEGVTRVIEQLAGVALPASLWEQQILPARVRDYAPAMLDELIATGVVVWAGHARLGEDDGLVSLHLTELASETLPPLQSGVHALSLQQQAVVEVLADGGAYFARQLAMQVHARMATGEVLDVDEVHSALWELVWQGRVTCDLWSPLRAINGARQQRPRALNATRRRRGWRGVVMDPEPGEPAPGRIGIASFSAPTLAGRWSLLQREPLPDTVRALALAEGLLDRHGIVTRGAAVAEGVAGGFPAIQQVYRGMEDSGRVLRGRFVQGLGGAQFAERALVDRLRELAESAPQRAAAIALSALDPANPFGTVVGWPAHDVPARPLRRQGALVVIGSGRLLLYLAQGGRSLVSYVDRDDPAQVELLSEAASALAAALQRAARARFTLELIDDAAVGRGPVTDALRAAGFSNAPRGLTWESRPVL